jgi:hypothetical protein
MRAPIALLVYFFAVPAAAQNLVVSDAPEAVSLTVYRASGQGEQPININWPQGYALITETRTITIPAGEALIRFEGVADGMFPESAIVTGLPNGVREKNRDARLLSPSGLVDAYLKRAVTITRTDKATGKTTSQEAMITSAPGGAVVLQTDSGYEALHCTGLPERLGYGGVPASLSAKPTLSVVTNSDRAVTVKLTLTYMSAGFDWRANYVAQVTNKSKGDTGSRVGKSNVELFAWLTLANGGNQSFTNANTMAIAGEPNRTRRGQQPRPVGGALQLKCWPMQRTDQVPFRPGFAPPPPPPMMYEASAVYAPAAAMDIAVTGRMQKDRSKLTAVVVAEQEDIGDLKLYRIPEPVTVNAKGQKQVAMLVKPEAAFDRYYDADVSNYSGASAPMGIRLRTDNLKDKGLGLPMPSGQVMIFEDSKYGPLLTAGRATIKDRAVGDEVKLYVGPSSDVRMKVVMTAETKKTQTFRVEVTNARNEAVNAEIQIPYQLNGKPNGVSKVDGVPTWKVTLPANSDAVLNYVIKNSQ